MHATLPLLRITDFPPLRRRRVETLQVNLGYTCNQTCTHCHVNAGPSRTEQMSRETIDTVLDVLVAKDIRTLDLTGGAPELNPHFRSLVREARQRGVRVMDRCNLTILFEPGQENLATFLADHEVEIVASLPCYLEDNVDKQRGKGVFDKSVRALQALNALGYGGDPRLPLSLVYNPQGPSLPPSQAALEADYRKFLGERFGIRFTRLYALANMPISRFGSTLISKGQFRDYMATLRAAHRPENTQDVMCRTMVSVDWQGYLYDCDFNQMLNLPLREDGRGHGRLRLTDWLELDLADNPILVADHCYGCTAGQGSSCGGALG
ncbi:MAG: arsenosugar biosynthesis radical SAM protein ArsS [Burkholderiales bacterium]|jgi:radical SAM/Cys-rich protein|nr:arsenosugar biosynthesis radical SAM protein ArsS [Burkholderiales bacterium]